MRLWIDYNARWLGGRSHTLLLASATRTMGMQQVDKLSNFTTIIPILNLQLVLGFQDVCWRLVCFQSINTYNAFRGINSYALYEFTLPCWWCLMVQQRCVDRVGYRSWVRLPALQCPVSTCMGDRLCAGKPSRYVTSYLGQLSLPSLQPLAGVKGCLFNCVPLCRVAGNTVWFHMANDIPYSSEMKFR